MMTHMILTPNQLTKTYKNQDAVKQLSLSIPRNTVYGLLGPNGAGKSTTLKMTAGIIKPTSGLITFIGKSWQRNNLNHIGALIEAPALYSNLSSYENLLVRTTALGLPTSRIDEVLELVDLTTTGKKKN